MTEVEWGVAAGRAVSASGVVDAAILAEGQGYDSFWVSNQRFYRDMLVCLGAVAERTNAIKLGTFVMDPISVHPAVSAAALATLDVLSGGRSIGAVGAGGSSFESMGLRSQSPLRNVEAFLDALRALLAGREVFASAPDFEIAGARLDVLPASPPPIVLASQSPRMLAMGGAKADAIMISSVASPETFGEAWRWVSQGAEEVGRKLDIGEHAIARIDMCLDDDRDLARDALKRLLGRTLVLTHPNWHFLGDLAGDVPPDIRTAAKHGDFDGVAHLEDALPDPVIDAFGWSGDADAVAAQVQAVLDLGVRRFVVLPHVNDGNPMLQLEKFQRRVVGQLT